MKDVLQKFMFANGTVRGELVDVSSAWQQVCAHRVYPVAVQAALGEMMTAAALLCANLKFNGALIMQIHGDGPVRLMVAECDSELHLRATVKLAENTRLQDDLTLTQLVNAQGAGRFVMTLDPKEKLPGQQPYQGIVPLVGESVAVMIENYMLHSEQLDTKLWLAANAQSARGLLLQKLPQEGSNIENDALNTWEHTTMLASTLKREELLNTDIQTLLHRLFWEEAIQLFAPRHPSFRCTCTRKKVGIMLKMLGQKEVEEALEEQGTLAVNCDFCGQLYEFDRIDCAQLFATNDAAIRSTPAHNQQTH